VAKVRAHLRRYSESALRYPPMRLNPDIPPKLEDVINKALEKDRNLRYQHAGDMRAELQRLKRDTDTGKSAPFVQQSSDDVRTGGSEDLASPLASSSARSARTNIGSSSRESAVRAESSVGVQRQSEAAHASSSSVAVAAAKQHKLGLAAGLVVGLIVLAAAGYGLYSLFANRTVTIPFQTFAVTQVTNSGKAALAGISPDGKYVVSVVDDNGKQSLWLRNVPTSSNTQILEADSAKAAHEWQG
jgi:serine/threonine protein kinase